MRVSEIDTTGRIYGTNLRDESTGDWARGSWGHHGRCLPRVAPPRVAGAHDPPPVYLTTTVPSAVQQRHGQGMRSELRCGVRLLVCVLYLCFVGCEQACIVGCEQACIPGRTDPGCYTVEVVTRLPRLSTGFTLVTQTSLIKLPHLEHALRTWDGYVSLALYAYDDEEREAFLGYTCANCSVTVVHGGRRGQPYPINLLRNIALQNAPTELIFTLDTDFLPSPGMYEHLLSTVPTLVEGTVFVVPAFELTEHLPVPSSYAALTAAVSNGTVRAFHCKRGVFHKDTQIDTWLNSNSSYCLSKTRRTYEPYIVANKTNPGFPAYNVSYVNRGMNKISWIVSLKQQQFRFCVLPHVYVIHEWEKRARYLPVFSNTRSSVHHKRRSRRQHPELKGS